MHDYRFPRTQREAGWHGRGQWDEEEKMGWLSIAVWGTLGAFVLWVFLVLVLG